MEKKELIDFGILEKYIREIEIIFERDGLNQIEQDLIIKQTYLRLAKKIQSQQTGDELENLPLTNLIKRLIGKKD